MNRSWLSSALLLAALLLNACDPEPTMTATSCGGTQTNPTVRIVDPDDAETAKTEEAQGQTLAFVAKVNPEEVNFQWELKGIGKLIGQNERVILYEAPASVDKEKVIVITVTITDKKTGCQALDDMSVRLLPRTPAPVTSNPTPTVTSSPTPTVISTPTVRPQPTATPTVSSLSPLLEIFPQAQDGQLFVFLNNGGNLSPQFEPSNDCRHSGPFGLKLTFRMAGQGDGGWGIKWNDAPTGHFNASKFTALSLWVKGEAPNGFQLGLKDTSQHEVKVETNDLVVISDASWQKVTIPLSEFAAQKGPVNKALVENINIGFNRNHGSGTLCIDDIAFE